MKNRYLVAVAHLFASSTAIAGWEAKEVPKTPEAAGDRYVLIYHQDAERGTKTINEAIEKLVKNGDVGVLQGLTVYDLMGDETFQQEIVEQLERNAPQAFDAAKRSAGNMHNPKMTALHADFAKAVRGTPTVTAISKSLAAYGMKISRPSFEKLELERKDQSFRFTGILWLSVEPVAATSEGEASKP